MKFPLVRELAAEGVPVAVTCRVMGFSKQAYFKWLRDPVSTLDWEIAHLTNTVVDAHHDDPTFGYRFLADELERQGLKVSENRVWRLCRDQRIWSNHSKKRGHAASIVDRVRPSTTTWSSSTSARVESTSCGSAISRSTRRVKASSTPA